MTTTAQLSENSHQGFDGLEAAICLGSMAAKSNTASGMPACLRQNGIGSRSSSKERDAETGLDYFLARYYSGAEGRFTSPDPLLISWRRIVNPQLWNGYSYVGNNPLRFVDPTGKELIQLGQHTDEEIKRRNREIQQELRNKQLSKDQKDALKKEGNTLKLEQQGNHTVGNMLTNLDKTGQRNGLQLSNCTLTTDTKNDFAGRLAADGMQKALGSQAFVVGGAGQIYIRTQSDTSFYQMSQRNSDYSFFGASALSHEQVHTNGGGEYPAYQRQDDVFHGFEHYFQNPDLYRSLDEFIEKGINSNQPK